LDIDNHILGPSDDRTAALCYTYKGYNKVLQNAFQYEEIKGRSLFGMRKGNRESDARPALADKAKLKFLKGNSY
jgi:hypothetical protein